MKFTRKAKVTSVVPTASMADISFLLLVFFMVTTVFVRHRGMRVELPAAQKIEELEMRRHVTSIWVNRQGAINIDDQIVPLDQVGAIMNGKLRANPRTVVSVKADASAQFGLLSDVLQELRKVEVLRVNFATSRQREDQP